MLSGGRFRDYSIWLLPRERMWVPRDTAVGELSVSSQRVYREYRFMRLASLEGSAGFELWVGRAPIR